MRKGKVQQSSDVLLTKPGKTYTIFERSEPLRAQLLVDLAEARAGDEFRISIYTCIFDGWHLYEEHSVSGQQKCPVFSTEFMLPSVRINITQTAGLQKRVPFCVMILAE